MSEDIKSIKNPEGEVKIKDHNPEIHAPKAPEVKMQRWLGFPEVIGFLYFISLATQYPVVQFWLFDHFSEEYGLEKHDKSAMCRNRSHNNSNVDLEDKVQSETNKYIMGISFISCFVAIFPTIFLGPLTDKYGRKFVFYVSFIGLFTSDLMIFFIFKYHWAPELLFISSFFLGVSGNYGLFLAGLFGMVADITSPGKQRAYRVTIMEATLAIAASVGASLSGIWLKILNYIWPMAFSMGAAALAIVIMVFIMPETLTDRHYQPFSCKLFMKSFEFYVKDTPRKRRFRLMVCIISFMTVVGAVMGEVNFGLLYLLHLPFCWSKVQIGVFNGILTLLRWVFVMLFIMLTRRHISETVFAMIGSVSCACGYLLKGLARSNALIFIGAGSSLLVELVSPMCRTMMSKVVLPDEQGALFSGIGVLQMVVSAVAGVVMSRVYDIGLDVYLGLPYLVLAGLVSVNVFLFVALIIYTRRHPQAEPVTGTETQKLLS